jgi:hypothetical protein
MMNEEEKEEGKERGKRRGYQEKRLGISPKVGRDLTYTRRLAPSLLFIFAPPHIPITAHLRLVPRFSTWKSWSRLRYLDLTSV